MPPVKAAWCCQHVCGYGYADDMLPTGNIRARAYCPAPRPATAVVFDQRLDLGLVYLTGDALRPFHPQTRLSLAGSPGTGRSPAAESALRARGRCPWRSPVLQWARPQSGTLMRRVSDGSATHLGATPVGPCGSLSQRVADESDLWGECDGVESSRTQAVRVPSARHDQAPGRALPSPDRTTPWDLVLPLLGDDVRRRTGAGASGWVRDAFGGRAGARRLCLPGRGRNARRRPKRW